MEQMRIRITLLEDMLGTAPADPEIYKSYIASKAPEAKSIEDELESIAVDEVRDSKMTVFHRDPATGEPIIYDYLIKGFFKNACSALRDVPKTKSSAVKAYKKKIDNLIFVDERMIHFDIAGEVGICERPLRASTPQGERVALSSSESIPAGSTAEFTITAFTKDVMELAIEWLNYGKFNGLGQWHNSGKGRFVWTDITDGSAN